MATTPSFVQITEGTGKKLSAATYVENSQTVYDEKTIPGEIYIAHYIAVYSNATIGAGGEHLAQLMAGASLNLRIRRIWVTQHAIGTGSDIQVQILRLTTAGTTGTAVTPAKLDPADAAAGAAGIMEPSVHGTESTILFQRTLPLAAAHPSVAFPEAFWQQHEYSKPIIVAAGTSNGIAVKNSSGAVATDTVDVMIEFAETSF